MNIKWNTVTWYSKLLAVIIYVGTFFVAYQMGAMMERAKSGAGSIETPVNNN